MRLRTVVASLALGVTLLIGPGLTTDPSALPAPLRPAPVAAADGCVDGWREMTLPSSSLSRALYGAVTRSGEPLWLLGGSHKLGQIAFHYRDGKWRKAQLPSTGTRGINDGSLVSGSKLLTAGYRKPGTTPLHNVAGTLTPSTWKDLRAPYSNSWPSQLSDIVTINKRKAWAVGSTLVRGRQRATAYRWNGSSWKRLDPPTGSGQSGLTAITRAPGGKIWAVGWKREGNGSKRPVIRRRASSGWKSVPAAGVPGSVVLTDVHFSASNRGWVVGYVTRPGDWRHEAVLQRWNGTAWNNVALPWADGKTFIPRSVVSHADGNLWIAGTRLANAEREDRGFLAERVDGTWTVRYLDVPTSMPSELNAVASTTDGALAAGRVGSTPIALESCPIEVAGDRKRIAVSDIGGRRAVREDDHENYDPVQPVPGLELAAVSRLPKPVYSTSFRMLDRTAAAGLTETTKSWDALAGDFDGDGWQDLFFSRHLNFKPRLYLGGSGGFKRASTAAFSIGDRHGCDAADVDKDGAVDIFCAFGRQRGTSLGRHELSLRVTKPDASLDRTALGASDPFGRGRQPTFFKLDGDGYPELFITNVAERTDGLPSGNRLFINDKGRFLPAAGKGLDHPVGGRCVWSGDADGDGDHDLITCVTRPKDGRAAGLRFYRNEGGKLRERSKSLDMRPMGDIDVVMADVTGDKRKDLIQLSSTRLRISRQKADGTFARLKEFKFQYGYGIAAGDVTGNKRADIYLLRAGPKSSKQNLRDHLLVSRKNGTKWKSIRMPQTTKGDAQDVVSLDYDKNGLADFFVLNGHKRPGPVKLIAAFKK